MTITKDHEGQLDAARERFIRALVALLRPLVLEDIGGADQSARDENEGLSTSGDIS